MEGLGFAIPMNDVMAMIQDIMTNGYVTNKPYLAVTAGTMNAQMAQQTNLTEGVYLYSVEKGGAADQAGLQVGDVITKVDDTAVRSMEDLNAAKKKYTAGDTAAFTVYRAGETVTVQVTWGAVPAEQQAPEVENQDTTQIPAQDGQGGYYGSPFDSFFDYFFGNRYRGDTGNAA